MPKQVQIRRHGNAGLANFTGALGEISVNRNTNELVVHDGTTAGGHPAANKADVLLKALVTAAGQFLYGTGNGVVATRTTAQIMRILVTAINAAAAAADKIDYTNLKNKPTIPTAADLSNTAIDARITATIGNFVESFALKSADDRIPQTRLPEEEDWNSTDFD